ncbi:MAG TPA: phosphoglycerate mutase family protein [Mycobacterium sp.]|uniref:histidine phosphatase family protein n=1 Tax=Mycobacterium sp. TaxID=1785 RepID=UPI002BEAF726|nr:phosphoglycerate mutase family protein [Mycobacterium sp.]HXO78355.1 phosphoglycerate mutase family protein [Mycobacterium sp.]
MRVGHRLFVIASVALIGAGVVVVTPTTAAVPTLHVARIKLTSGDAQDIVIDIVRHGQRLPPFNEVVTPSPDYPGPPLSDLGQQQAQDVGSQLFNELGQHVAGIFSGQSIRDLETAAPFATLEHMSDAVQVLPGLNEIDSGIYAGDPLDSLGGYLYQETPLLWTLFGLVLAPIPGSSDINGIVSDNKFTDAVDAMYNAAMANPVVSADGQITDVAFNNEADVAAWVALNVKNPDIPILLNGTIQTLLNPDGDGNALLPGGGVVEIEGNPTDGWTLVSWDGQPVPADPGVLTQFVMALRDLIIAPQTAAWNIYEAALGGDPATLESAVQAGVQSIDAALVQFPEMVINDIVGASQNLATETSAQAVGEAGMSLSDAFASF